MSHQPEKTSRIAGFVMSVLLHAIFFAACIALDAGTFSPSTSDTEVTQLKPLDHQADADKPKS